MKRLILLIAVIAAAMVAVAYYFPDRAVVNLEIGHWAIQTTAMGLFMAVVAGLIVLWLAYRLLQAVAGLPGRMRDARAQERRRKADDQLLKAFAERAELDSAAAINTALARVDEASMPPLHYLFAIDARIDGLKQIESQERDEQIRALEEQLGQTQRLFPKFSYFLRLHIGKRLLDAAMPEAARTVLKPAFKAKPKDKAVLQLQLRLLQAENDHAGIAALLPTLRRHKLPGLAPKALAELEERSFLGQLQAAVADEDTDRLSRLWAQANPQIAAQIRVVRAYADCLNQIGAPVSAAKVLEKRMGQDLNAGLLHDWAELAHDDLPAASQRLSNLVPAEFNQPRQANTDPNTSTLRSAYAYAQAAVLLAADKAEQARTWLGKIESLDHDWRYLKVAARVHAKLDDHAEASILFERAIKKLRTQAGKGRTA